MKKSSVKKERNFNSIFRSESSEEETFKRACKGEVQTRVSETAGGAKIGEAPAKNSDPQAFDRKAPTKTPTAQPK